MENRIDELIASLNLMPHPEGGWYRETYRSNEVVVPTWTINQRSLCTSIYYLLTKGQFSSFHRIQSDEIWHHYDGDEIRIVAISPDRKKYEWILGKTGENITPQVIVPARWWFAAETMDASHSTHGYTLAGCTVSPGFDFNDFEMAARHYLIEKYPEYKDDIIKLTR